MPVAPIHGGMAVPWPPEGAASDMVTRTNRDIDEPRSPYWDPSLDSITARIVEAVIIVLAVAVPFAIGEVRALVVWIVGWI